MGEQVYGILDVLDFGQYKGSYVGTVCEEDPDYIIWLDEETERVMGEGVVAYARQFI